MPLYARKLGDMWVVCKELNGPPRKIYGKYSSLNMAENHVESTIPKWITEVDLKIGNKRVVVLGKGPSLDRFIPDPNDFLVALNEAAMVFPKVDVSVFNDNHVGKKLNLNPKTIKVSPVGNHFYPVCHPNNYTFTWTKLDPAKKLYGLFTAGIALSVLGYHGVKDVYCVGMDGYDKDVRPAYASSIRNLAITERNNGNYNKENRQIDYVVDHFKMKLIFFHRDYPEYSSGQ